MTNCHILDRVNDTVLIGGHDPTDCNQSEGCYLARITDVWEEGEDELFETGDPARPLSIAK